MSNDLEREFKDRTKKVRSIFWGTTFLMLTTIGMSIASSILVTLTGGGYWTLMTVQAASSICVFLLSAFLAIFISERTWCGSDAEWKFDPITAICCIILAFSCQPLISWAAYLNVKVCTPAIMEWAKAFDVDQNKVLEQILSFEPVTHYVAAIIIIAIVPAICEEMFFRGVILRGMTAIFRSHASAIIVSAIFFSMLHLDIEGFLPRVAMGIILGFIYIKTNNLIYSMLFHAANNAMVIVSLSMSEATVSETLSAPVENPGPTGPIISLAITMWICWMIAERYRNAEGSL